MQLCKREWPFTIILIFFKGMLSTAKVHCSLIFKTAIFPLQFHNALFVTLELLDMLPLLLIAFLKQ